MRRVEGGKETSGKELDEEDEKKIPEKVRRKQIIRRKK